MHVWNKEVKYTNSAFISGEVTCTFKELIGLNMTALSTYLT